MRSPVGVGAILIANIGAKGWSGAGASTIQTKSISISHYEYGYHADRTGRGDQLLARPAPVERGGTRAFAGGQCAGDGLRGDDIQPRQVDAVRCTRPRLAATARRMAPAGGGFIGLNHMAR